MRVVAATATTPAQLAGLKFAALAAELPAATTTTAPRAMAPLTAACVVVSQAPPPPSDRLITRAGVALAGAPATVPPEAQVIASAMSEVYPPHLPSTRTGCTRALNAMPATPAALLVLAAIVPATWVPCQLESLAGSPTAHSPAATQSPGSEGSLSRAVPSLDTAVSMIMS